MPTRKKSATAELPKQTSRKIGISELNVRRAATRLLNAPLVSTEIAYVQHTLGASATQEALDAKVLAVRSMPWASIVLPE